MTIRVRERRLVLWDVDHTLIETRGVGRRLYAAAFETVAGRPVEHKVDITGRTELAIFAETLQRHGIEPTDALVARYRAELARQYDTHIDELRHRGRVLPGAAEALAALAVVPGLVQTVLTGNLQAVAVTKLHTFGLHKHIDFAVGAYGDDDSVRARLVAVAQRRAGGAYATRFDRENTVVIGDTTSDVAAAHHGGAKIVAVASGRDDADALRRSGAEVVLESLVEVERLHKALAS